MCYLHEMCTIFSISGDFLFNPFATCVRWIGIFGSPFSPKRAAHWTFDLLIFLKFNVSFDCLRPNCRWIDKKNGCFSRSTQDHNADPQRVKFLKQWCWCSNPINYRKFGEFRFFFIFGWKIQYFIMITLDHKRSPPLRKPEWKVPDWKCTNASIPELTLPQQHRQSHIYRKKKFN